MTQNMYRRPVIGARDAKPVALPTTPVEPSAKVFSAIAPQASKSEKPTSYPSWLIPAKPDAPSSYPKFQATYIGGSPCTGTFHQIT